MWTLTLPATEPLPAWQSLSSPPPPERWPAPTYCLPWPLAFGCGLGEKALPDAPYRLLSPQQASLGGHIHPAVLPMGAWVSWEQVSTFLCDLRPPPDFSEHHTPSEGSTVDLGGNCQGGSMRGKDDFAHYSTLTMQAVMGRLSLT